MLQSDVMFKNNSGLNIEVFSVQNTRLHMHKNVAEVVFVLKGELNVKVSCENFDMKAGDYALLNQGDPHYLRAGKDNMTAIFYFDLKSFVHVNPYIQSTIFTCESFDLARYHGQERLIRESLLELLRLYAENNVGSDNQARISKRCAEFMELMLKEYTLIQYYNRNAEIPEEKREKLFRIMQIASEKYFEKNILDLIAEKEYYSKSYISHLFKTVSATSLGDMLTYLRLAEAEKQLLMTEHNMQEISSLCGFSDIKYFNRDFRNWFGQSPLEYRKTYKKEVRRDDNMQTVDMSAAVKYIEDKVGAFDTDESPRLSVTPILLKNAGSKKDLFKRLEAFREEAASDDDIRKQNRLAGGHIMPIAIAGKDGAEGSYILECIARFSRTGITPCLVFEFISKASILARVGKICEELGETGRNKVLFWITYGNAGDGNNVEDIAALIKSHWDIEPQIIFTP